MAIRRNESRDYDIYVRHMNGENAVSLGKEFGISRSRIIQIVYDVKHECELAKRYSEARYRNYKGLNGLDTLLARYGAFVNKNVIIRAFNALRVAKPCNSKEEWQNVSINDFLKKADSFSYDQLLKCRNIGVKSAEFIEMVKKDFAP